MKIKHKKVSLAPDSGDATLLQPSDWNQDHEVAGFKSIDENTTFTIKADGTGSYPTLKACMDDMNITLIHPSAKVTVRLDAGIHIQSGEIRDWNPGDIQLIGEDVSNVNFSAATVSGTADNFTVVYTLIGSVPAGVTVGMFMTVHNAGLALTGGHFHFGCHEITALTANSITCLVKNRNTPQTLSAVAVPCTIIKTVVKAGFTGENLIAITSGSRKGKISDPYMKNICFNGANLVNRTIRVGYATTAHLSNSTDRTYSLGAVNAVMTGLYVVERSFVTCYNGCICISSSGSGGIWVMQQAYVDCEWNMIITGCRGADNWQYAAGADFGYVLIFNPILIDNRHSITSANGGQVRYTTATHITYWGNGPTEFQGGDIIYF